MIKKNPINAYNFQLKRSKFERVKISDETSGFKSYFTDEEAINLLRKVSNRNIIRLANEFNVIKLEESDRQNSLRVHVHVLCNKILEKFGSKLLTFIYDLKIQNEPETKIDGVIEVSDFESFSEIDFPGFHERSQNLIYSLEEVEINVGQKEGFLIVCNSSGGLLYRVNKNGRIDSPFINIVNRLKFHIFEVKEDNKVELYSNVLNVRCRVCGRELTNPTSIYYGIGDDCARNLNYR